MLDFQSLDFSARVNSNLDAYKCTVNLIPFLDSTCID